MESIEYDFVLGRDYPHPIIDIEVANRKARVILYGMKRTIDPSEKARIFEKHGSRKSPRKKSQKKDIQPINDTLLTLF